uniref:hypothetical protein n=1 Tax=Cupriavidus taiwanensis TaxID=164546 RepID=UPI003F4917D4
MTEVSQVPPLGPHTKQSFDDRFLLAPMIKGPTGTLLYLQQQRNPELELAEIVGVS